MRVRLQESEHKLGISMPIDLAKERITQLEAKATSLERYSFSTLQRYSFRLKISVVCFVFDDSVNTRGALLCAREAANRLKRGGGGRIILLSSSLVQSFKPSFGSYTASKAAIETMSKILAKELKGTQITVLCFSRTSRHRDVFCGIE